MIDILRLVSMLSASERIYFKKNLNPKFSGKKKNHILLYEAIIRNPDVTIEELKGQFKGTSIEKHFASEMNYLFEAIMKALIQKSFIKAQDRQAIKYVLSVDLLLEKGLIKRAHKTVAKAKSLAYHFEDFTTLVKAIEQEERVLFLEGTLPNGTQISELIEERREILNKSGNLVYVQLLAERVTSIQPNKGYLTESKLHKEILEKPVFLDKSHCKSMRALERWFYTRVFTFDILARHEEFLRASTAYLDFLKEYNYLFEPITELVALSDYLKALTMTGQFDEFQDLISNSENFTRLMGVNEAFSSKVRMYLLVRKMEHANITRNRTYMKQALADSITLGNIGEKLLPVATWEFYSLHKMACYLQLNQFDLGMAHYDRWYSRTSNIHISRFMRLFKLILILELGIDKIMDSELEATRKFLAKRPLPKRLQAALLTFFRKAFRAFDDHFVLLRTLETELVIFEGEPEAKHMRKYFNFLAWCQDCISRKNKIK